MCIKNIVKHKIWIASEKFLALLLKLMRNPRLWVGLLARVRSNGKQTRDLRWKVKKMIEGEAKGSGLIGINNGGEGVAQSCENMT